MHSEISTPVLFADDTSILFTCSDTTELNSDTHTIFETVVLGLKTIVIKFKKKKKKTRSIHF